MLKQLWKDRKKDLESLLSRTKNKKFAKASMALSALVALANGVIKSEEEEAVADAIVTNKALSVFDPKWLQEIFHQYCNEAKQGAISKANLRTVIIEIKEDGASARFLIDLGIEIGSSDGDFDENEKDVMKKACVWLGIDSNEFEALTLVEKKKTTSSAVSDGCPMCKGTNVKKCLACGRVL